MSLNRQFGLLQVKLRTRIQFETLRRFLSVLQSEFKCICNHFLEWLYLSIAATSGIEKLIRLRWRYFITASLPYRAYKISYNICSFLFNYGKLLAFLFNTLFIRLFRWRDIIFFSVSLYIVSGFIYYMLC